MTTKLLLSLSLVASISLLTGCSEETKDEAKKAVEATTNVVAPALEDVKKAVTPTLDKITKAIEEQAPEMTKVVKENIEVAKAKIHEATAPTKASKSGKDLYSSCAACHGSDGSKKALGKSEVIKGWDASKVEQALNGYKDGTYGGPMKGVMKGQVMKLGDSDIKTLSTYISNL